MGNGSLDSLSYQGAKTLYKMAKMAYKKGKNAVRDVKRNVTTKPTQKNNQQRTQDLNRTASQPQNSKEYKENMDKEYGSGFYGFINGMFGGKI